MNGLLVSRGADPPDLNNFTVVKRWKFKAGTPPTEDDLKAIDAEVSRVLGAKKK